MTAGPAVPSPPPGAPRPTPAHRSSVAVVFADGDTRRYVGIVRDQVERGGREVLVAAADAGSLGAFDGIDAEPLVAPSAAAAVNAAWQRTRSDVFVVSDVALIPSDAPERAEALLGADLRHATVSFFSNDAGPASFPTNHPTPMPPAGFDHESLTARLRSVDPEPVPCPVPYAAGAAVLLSSVAMAAVGGLDAVPEGVSFSGCLADFSMRCRTRGFVDLLDAGTFVTRVPTPGRELNHPVMSDADRAWLLVRHPQLVEAFEREPEDAETPVTTTTRAARVKVMGLRVLVDDATLGPLETGAQITTLAIIDALAKRDDVAEVGVALGHHIPGYARAVLGQPKIHPALRAGSDYGAFDDYDVVHRTAQPDKDFAVDAARGAARRVVVSILDLIAYRAGSYHATAADWLRYRSVLRDAVRHADGVTTISEDVALALELEMLPVEPDRVFPILYGTEHLSGREPAELPQELVARGRVAGEFVFCLGTDYAHKNRDLAIAVHHDLRRRGCELALILAGPSVPYGSSRMAERELLADDGDVVFLPNVTSRERNWLFRHAAAVLYPTSAEGFGLVPFEAARFGTPTVTVGFGPLLETSAGVPVVASSWDARELADCLERLLCDPVLRREQVSATLAAADRYSWRRTAEAFVRMYRTLLARPSR